MESFFVGLLLSMISSMLMVAWLVGNQACLGHGGNRIWMRITCDETVYGPPLNTHCTTLDGPATCASPPGEAERLA